MLILKKFKVFIHLPSQRKGFTLIEVLISISIFIIIFTLTIVNYRQGENANIFRLQSFDVEDSIRSVQNMALTGQKINNFIPDAYGVYFSKVDNKIIIYGDMNDNNIFDNKTIDEIYSSEDLQEDIFFKNHTLFCDGSSGSSAELNLIFIPPELEMIINNNSTCTSSLISLESDDISGNWNIYFDAETGRTWTNFTD